MNSPSSGTGSGGSRKCATPTKTLNPIFSKFNVLTYAQKLSVVRGPYPLAIKTFIEKVNDEKKSRSKKVNFEFWGSEPLTLNLRYRCYGGICRGCGEGSCGERIFRLSFSVPEIFDLKLLPFDLICIQTGSGRGKMTSSPDRGRRGLQSLGRA